MNSYRQGNGGNRGNRGLSLLVLFMCVLFMIGMANTNAEETRNETTKTDAPKKEEKIAFPEKQWGTYYDPQNIFCGQYDCYKILGFDFELWGRSPPSKKELTQSYRGISKKWHPDKNKDKGAKERFVKINKAYSVLTNKKKREEYDFLRERNDEYFRKYGSPTIFKYAPKTDTLFVVVLLVAILNAFTWFAQKQRWRQIADRIVKDASEGLEAGKGGSTESIRLRKKAEEILKEKKEAAGETTENGGSKKKSKSKIKLTKKELKEKENEELKPIIQELVEEIKDFGAGFHQPTYRDLLIVRMIKWPKYIVEGLLWQSKYLIRRLRKLELNDEECMVLTKRAIGPVAWEAASDEDRTEAISRELWVMENLEQWNEDQQIRQYSKGQQKRINRVKKKEAWKKQD